MSAARQSADVFLAPGQLAVHTGPVKIKTIVGSCVAVCLWDPVARVGGVNHFLLAQPGPGEPPDTRFGACATAQLIAEACRAGAARTRLVAAVIGGGHPVHSIKTHAIGDDNVAVALAVLAEHGVHVVRQETGGAYGRKLLFNTQTGELIVRRLNNPVGALPNVAE